MPVVDIFPYAEALVAQELKAVTGRGAFSSLPRAPVWPLLVVKRLGGVPVVREWVDRARLQIESWGTSKTEAQALAQQARAVIIGMEGRTFTLGGGDADDAVVTGVEDDLGIAWFPDPVTNRDRYIFGMALVLHPIPA